MAKKQPYKIQRDFQKFGNYLREARLNQGFTQNFVARRLKYSSAQFVSNMERGIAPPPFSKLKILISLYDMDPHEVIDQLLEEQRTILARDLSGK